MNITINDIELKSVWDIQRAKLILSMCGLSSDGINGLNSEDRKTIEKEIILYLWKKINEQFPKIKSFCVGKTGGFNKIEEKNFNTPIINIGGSFYMQLISLNNKNNWCWETIELEPCRFEFNEEGYFKGLVVDAMNKSILSGYGNKEKYDKLINALNETKTQESFITIDKNFNVDLKKHDTTII